MDRTAVVQGRVDHKTLAGIAMFMYESGQALKTKSEMVSLACEYLYTDLIRAGKILPVPTTEMALQILDLLGLDKTNKAGRGLRLLRETIVKENEALDKARDPRLWLISQAASRAEFYRGSTDLDAAAGIKACVDEGPSIKQQLAEAKDIVRESKPVSEEAFKALNIPDEAITNTEEYQRLLKIRKERDEEFKQQQASEDLDEILKNAVDSGEE
jgi:hypothetical protein